MESDTEWLFYTKLLLHYNRYIEMCFLAWNHKLHGHVFHTELLLDYNRYIEMSFLVWNHILNGYFLIMKVKKDGAAY